METNIFKTIIITVVGDAYEYSIITIDKYSYLFEDNHRRLIEKGFVETILADNYISYSKHLRKI